MKNNILFLLILLSTLTFSQISKRVYTIGNSVTDGINYDGFNAIANLKGNSLYLKRHMIPGAPLFIIYNSMTTGDPNSPFGFWPNDLGNNDWDCISFQPFDRDILGDEGDYTNIKKWIDYIKEKRSTVDQLQIYIYSRYPRVPQGKTYQNATADDWNRLWLGTYGNGGQPNEVKDYFINLMNTIRGENLLPKPANLIPVGDVMYQLNQKMVTGKLSGYNSVWDFYYDGIHMNNLGSFTLGATFFATMYKQDPRGISVPSQYGNIPTAIRDTILQTIFEVVFVHPYSGASLADIVPPSGLSISPKSFSLSFLQSQTITPTVLPSNASNKNVLWSSNNTSVATVDNKGKVTGVGSGVATIVGTTSQNGFSDFSVVTVSGISNYTSVSGVLIGWDYAFRPLTASGMNATFVRNGISTVAGDSYSGIANGLDVRDDNFSSGTLMAVRQTTTDLLSSIAANEYFSFYVKPVEGKLINITKLSYRPNSQEFGHTYILMSSLKGFNSTQIISTFTGNSGGNMININISGHNNISQQVEFRLYITGNPSLVGSDSFVAIGAVTGNDFQIEGAVITPVDNTNPSSVTGLSVSLIKEDGFMVSWQEATDNMVVWGYNIYNNGVKINSQLVKETSINLTSLTSGSMNLISVTAVDFVGNESIASSISVLTNRKPTALMGLDNNIGYTPLTVQFNSQGSTDPDIDSGDFVLGFDWDFGNGQVSSSNSAQIVYSTPGIYTVSLRVVDTRELRSEYVYTTITILSEITPPTPPSMLTTIAYQNTSVVVSFTGGSDNLGVAGYLLSIDGVSYNNSPISQTVITINGLTNATTYRIGIQTLDISGNVSEVVESNIRTNSNPEAIIWLNTTSGYIPFSLSVSGAGSTDSDSDVLGYSWTLGGVVFTTPDFETNITVAGIYLLRLEVKDENGGVSLATQQIEVKAGSVTGIDMSMEESKKLKIYPNPTNDYLNISESSKIQLIDSMGEIVFASEAKLTLVDMSKYPKGIYYLILNDKQGFKVVKE